MRLFRFRLGRFFLHLGLRILPPGRVRSELYALMDQWSSKVMTTISQNNMSHFRLTSNDSIDNT